VTAGAVRSVPDGGSFGGKRFSWLEPLARRATEETGRPVILTLSREESIRCGPTRHGARGHLTVAGGRVSGEVTFVAGEASLCPDDVLDMARWCLSRPYDLVATVDLGVETTAGPPSGWMRGEGSLAVVALREAAIGPGVATRRARLTPRSPEAGCLDELADWLGGEEPPGVAIHVGRLPPTQGVVACWEEGALVHPFLPIADLPIPQRASGEAGPCPRGGGWPFVLVSLADGASPSGPGPAVAAAVLSGRDGTIEEVRVVIDAGRIVDPVAAEGHARGGAHMGLGAALSERVVREGGVTRSLTIRSLGVIPAAATPPVAVRFRGSGPALAGIAEACVAPVAAATMMATGGRSLPDPETAAARQVRRQR